MTVFSGPLFVVGSPRSGTKLLRDLLNRNSQINLCDPESHFIPYLYRKFGGRADRFHVDLDSFFHEFDRMPFQIFARRMGKPVMARTDFDALNAARNWTEALGMILRFYGDPDAAPTAIWGDKTPSYVREMPLLKEILPQARFIHIIRDPRDVALSVRAAWRHDIYRTATKWARNVAAGRRDGAVLSGDYMEIFYEDLLGNPEVALKRACDFLGVDYVSDMTSLARPSENIGSAAGKSFIDSSNLGKFRQRLTPRQQRRIEEIVYTSAAGTPYHLDHAVRHVPLSIAMRGFVAGKDSIRSVVRYMRKKGLVDGLRINIGNRLQKRRRPS